jgi:condensin complex subunit 2
MRGRRVRLNENDGEVDEAFWAQAAADQAAANREHDADNDGDDREFSALLTFELIHIGFSASNPAPFATQFLQEDDFGGGFDDDGGFDGEGRPDDDDTGEQDLLAATQGQTRRVRPEFVNYARRAKRVDVRKLKDNIWKGLSIVVPQDQKDEEEGSMVSISNFILD